LIALFSKIKRRACYSPAWESTFKIGYFPDRYIYQNFLHEIFQATLKATQSLPHTPANRKQDHNSNLTSTTYPYIAQASLPSMWPDHIQPPNINPLWARTGLLTYPSSRRIFHPQSSYPLTCFDPRSVFDTQSVRCLKEDQRTTTSPVYYTRMTDWQIIHPAICVLRRHAAQSVFQAPLRP